MSTLAESLEKMPPERLREHLATVLSDAADADTRIRALCKQVLPEAAVDGDSYGVPHLVDLVETLVNLVAALRAKKDVGAGGDAP